MSKGAFIVIEGLDGSGKTTQARQLVRSLKKAYDVVFTAEPSKGKIGKFIRNQLLYGEKRLPTEIEALLFAADRLDHLQSEVLPIVSAGGLAISDRYLHSSLAYQGSSGLSLDWIHSINQLALAPDLALYIDIKPETVLKRLRRKKSIMEILETQKKVREIYLKYVENGSLIKIDGEKPKREVAREILDVTTDFLENRAKLSHA
jgi:dTMP kinase